MPINTITKVKNMDTKNMINVTEASLTDLAQAAYELSVPVGMGIIHFEEGCLSSEDALSLIKEDGRMALRMDYVHGRQCKFNVYRSEEGDLWVEPQWYDHTREQLILLLKMVGIETPLKGEHNEL